MNQKPLFLAVALAALLVIGGAFWVMQKRQMAMNQAPVVIDPVVETPVQTEPESSVDTSDWKTYRNEEYGVQFRYPSDERWKLQLIDFSKDKSLLNYPEKSINVFFSPMSLDGRENAKERLVLNLRDSVWGSGNTHFRNQNDPNVYMFDFHGQKAIADKPWGGELTRDAVYNFFNNQKCIGTVVFGIPGLAKPWESNETVNIFCGSSGSFSENTKILKTIVDSVTFF